MQSDSSGDVMSRKSRLLWRCAQAIDIVAASRLQGPFSVTRARILFELAQRQQTAAELGRALYLDAGYLSRTLRWFEHQGVLTRLPTDADVRQRLLYLTSAGHQAYALLARHFQRELAELFAELNIDDHQQVLNGLLTLDHALAKNAANR